LEIGRIASDERGAGGISRGCRCRGDYSGDSGRSSNLIVNERNKAHTDYSSAADAGQDLKL